VLKRIYRVPHIPIGNAWLSHTRVQTPVVEAYSIPQELG
jgi:hypothetical protein